MAEHYSIQQHHKAKSFLSNIPRGSEDATEEKAKLCEATLWYLKQPRPTVQVENNDEVFPEKEGRNI